VFIVREDYEKVKDKLSGRIVEKLDLLGIIVFEATVEDLRVLSESNVRYSTSTSFHVHEQIKLPSPRREARAMTPDRLYALTIEPLVRAMNYLALDTLTRPICVLDTGINKDHILFSMNYNYIVADSVIDGEDGRDNMGHGSHVAGIISILAPYSTIVSIKMFPRTGRAETLHLLRGLEKCLAYNCYVVNMSLGGYPSKQEREVIDYALAKLYGNATVLVGAVGNDSLYQSAYPASSELVIGVGSVSDTLLPSYFNNKDFVRRKPDVTAFGERILSASHVSNTELVEMTGTSMATPVVSALAYNLLFLYENVAREAEAVILGVRMDGKLPPHISVRYTLYDFARRNNPLKLYNVLYGHGIASFHEGLSVQHVNRSYGVRRPQPIAPSMRMWTTIPSFMLPPPRLSQLIVDYDLDMKGFNIVNVNRLKASVIEVGDIMLKYGWRIVERPDGIYVVKDGKLYRLLLQPVNN
jgi:hypothetical protein